jgi:hypothetical protein
MKNHFKYYLAFIYLGLLHTLCAQAALQSRQGGAMLYDTDLDITWVADANSFKTQTENNSNFVNQVILDNGGIVSFYSDLRFEPISYSLSSTDFDLDSGNMNWFGAIAWTDSLNSGGHRNWTLPTEDQLAHLYFDELGGTLFESIIDTHNNNYFMFKNIQPSPYWSINYSSFGGGPGNSGIRVVEFNSGYRSELNFLSFASAWAVHPGDIYLPLPSASYLFLLSILSFCGLKFISSVAPISLA